MATVDLELDQGEIDALTQGPDGPVTKMIEGLTVALLDEALNRCPRGESGELAASHVSEVSQTSDGAVGSVTAEAPYAAAVHNGSVAHEILPNTAPVLRFPDRAGFIVFAKKVDHPGYAGNPWLADALDEVIGAFG